jgi:FkbH-like protein
VPFEKLFPIEIGWGPKSEAVNRILQAWNVAAGSVVFVDDSPIELAEVQQRFPEVVGLQFPTSDNGAAMALAGKLRDLFGKTAISEEDRLRAASIRTSAQISESLGSGAEISEAFLEGLCSEIVADFRIDENDNRLFDLINKTNQFNLNGHRIDLAEWRRKLVDPDQVVLALSYNDKFGPLGKISAVLGRLEHHEFCISHWVLSCRAFGRRLEHATLVILIGRPGCRSTNSALRKDAQEQTGRRPFYQPGGQNRERPYHRRPRYLGSWLSQTLSPHGAS